MTHHTEETPACTRRSFVGLASWLLIAPGVVRSAGGAGRQPSSGVQVASGRPLAIRGGVLLTPLSPRRPASGWPSRVEVSDGARTFEGEVIVIEAADPPLTPHWTTDPRDAIVRAIDRDDDFSDDARAVDDATGPYLAAVTPEDVGATLTINGETIRPRWFDAPSAVDGPAWLAELRPDRPDPFSAFEHWRWALLAEADGASPPALDRFPQRAAQLVASYYADLWRAGLARLEASSRGVADACRRALTAICRDEDEGTDLGVWTCDPLATGSLLRTLLQPSAGDAMTRAALAWSDAQARMEIWTESESGSQVRLAIANGSVERRVLRFTWARQPDDIPIATNAPAHTVTRVSIDRPGMSVQVDPPSRAEEMIGGRTLDAASGAGDELLIEVDGAIETSRVFRRPWADARPPRIVFPAPAPAMTLREAAGVGAIIGPAALTVITLRSAHRRWELFFECLRASPADSSSAGGGGWSRLEDLAGEEAVGAMIGGQGSTPRVLLAIPEVGEPRVLRGASDSTLSIRRNSYADRWYARVTLPASWLDGALIPIARDPDAPDAPPPPVKATSFAFVRGHAGLEALETSPHPTPSWRSNDLVENLGRAMVTLESWPALP